MVDKHGALLVCVYENILDIPNHLSILKSLTLDMEVQQSREDQRSERLPELLQKQLLMLHKKEEEAEKVTEHENKNEKVDPTINSEKSQVTEEVANYCCN